MQSWCTESAEQKKIFICKLVAPSQQLTNSFFRCASLHHSLIYILSSAPHRFRTPNAFFSSLSKINRGVSPIFIAFLMTTRTRNNSKLIYFRRKNYITISTEKKTRQNAQKTANRKKEAKYVRQIKKCMHIQI